MTNRDQSNAKAKAKQLPNIIQDARDMDLLLRLLYNGQRPTRVHTLFCACGLIADRRGNPDAWNGWRVLPHPKCPDCLVRESQPYLARERFSRLVLLLVASSSLPTKEGEA